MNSDELMERQALVLNTHLSAESLLSFIPPKAGEIYVLSDGFYTVTNVRLFPSENGGVTPVLSNNDTEGIPYPDTLEQFVESVLSHPKFLGFVPVTDRASEVVKTHGLSQTEGYSLLPENIAYSLFHQQV